KIRNVKIQDLVPMPAVTIKELRADSTPFGFFLLGFSTPFGFLTARKNRTTQSHEPRRVRFRLGELVISGVGLTAIFNLPYFTRELWNAVFRSRPTLVHIMCHGLGLPPDFFLR